MATNDSKLLAGLKRASKSIQAFGQGITSIASKAALLDIAKILPLAHAAKLFADMGSALVDMSDRTGIGIEKLDELGFAAEQSGSNMEELEIGLKKMQDNLGGALAEPAGLAAQAFAKLGLSVRQLMGLSPDEQFKVIADRISKIPNPALRASMAIDVFGKAGTKLLPMMKDGAAGLNEMAAEAHRLGLVMSTSDAQAAEKFGDDLSALWSTLKRVWATVGSALVPVLQDAAKWISTTAAGIGKWIKENKGLVEAIFLGAVGFVALEVAVAAAGVAISTFGSVLGGVAIALKLVGAAIVFLTSPIGLVIVGLGLLATWFFTATQAGVEALQWLGKHFMGLKDTALGAFEGIADALAAGDIALAGKIVWASLKLGWQQLLLFFQEGWQAFKGFFLNIGMSIAFGFLRMVNEAWAGVRVAWTETTAFMKAVWTETVAALEVAWVETVAFLGNAWDMLIAGLKKGWNHFAGFFQKVWAKIKSVFSDTDADAEIEKINKDVAGKDQEIEEKRNKSIADREGRREERRQEIEQGRGADRGRIEEERQKSRANIEADRAAAEQGLNEEQKAEQEKQRKAKEAALAGAQGDVDAARKEFDAARAEAKQKRKESEVKGPEKPGGPVFPNVGDMLTDKSKTRGTFSAATVRALGSEDVASKTAKATDEIAKNTKETNRLIKGGQARFA